MDPISILRVRVQRILEGLKQHGPDWSSRYLALLASGNDIQPAAQRLNWSMSAHSSVCRPLHGTRQAILLTQALVLLLLAILGFCYSLFGFHAEPWISPACILLAVLFVWSLWSWSKVQGTLFDPYVVFLLAATLFNGGQALLEVFHLNKEGILGGAFSPDLILRSLFLVTIGLTALHFGALLSVLTGKKRSLGYTSPLDASTAISKRLRQVGWGLLLISFLPATLLFRDALATVLSAGYYSLFQKQAATGFGAITRVLAGFLVPAGLFLLAGSQRRRREIVASAVVVLGYAAYQLFLGSRSAAVMPLVAYAWLWHGCVRPLPMPRVVAVGAILLLLVFPLVRAVRDTAGNERLGVGILAEAFASIENPETAAVSEMGWSMTTVAHTLDLVPAVRSFDMGAGYLYGLLTLFPNLFWDIHPTVAHGLAHDWLVGIVDPMRAARGGTLGFSFIAEAYLNFGWIGTPVLLSLLGFIYVRFILWATRSGNPARLAAVASFLAFFPMFARGESGTILRELVWYALVPYFLVAVGLRREHARP